MAWIAKNGFIVFLLACYAALLVYHAWRGNRQTHGVLDYYVGGRSMGGAAIGLSFFATYSSTNSFVGFAGQAYTYGAPWLLLMPFAVVLSGAAWIWVAPRLRDFTAALDSMTIPDFMGFRFNSALVRKTAAVIVLFASFLYMTAVYKGIGNLLQSFFNIPYWTAIVIVLFIVMAYTAVGGFYSVVHTDVVQAVIMIVAAGVLFFGITDAAGGIDSFWAVRDRPQTAGLFRWDAAMPLAILLGILFAGTTKFLVEPRQLSRFYALQDKRAARTGAWVSTLTFLLVYSLLVPIGIYAHNILPAGITDSDQVVPRLLSDASVFHPWVSAFLFLAMISAAMSSLDSVLLVMASTCHRDIIGLGQQKDSERGAVRATRFYVALFAVITAAIALNPPGGIVTLTAFSGSLYAACFMPAIILGISWRQGNSQAVMASFAVGLACLFFWKFLPLSSALHRVFPAVVLSVLTYVIVSLLTPQYNSEKIDRLFISQTSQSSKTHLDI